MDKAEISTSACSPGPWWSIWQRKKATIVLWSALPRDWQDADGWVDRALGQIAAQPWSLMVLHDLPTGAMRHLDRFLGLVADRGGRVRQDFPPECLPMIDGRLAQPLDRYLAD